MEAMSLLKRLSVGICLAVPLAWGNVLPYSMADLEALVASQGHQEFFQHALDIRPSERDPRWNQMVEEMGESLLRLLADKPRLERADFHQAETLMGWAALARHEFFRQRRQDLGLRWIQQCLAGDASPTSPCWQDVLGFWAKDRQDPDVAPRLLALLEPHFRAGTPPVPLTPYYVLRPLLLSPLAELQCKKDVVRNVLWAEARAQWARQESAMPLAHEGCWTTLEPWLHGLWRDGATLEDLVLAQAVLEARGKLDPMEKDLFQVVYLLGRPSRGETFNLAWNRVRDLGGQPARREELMGRLRAWRPLPGEVFANLDLEKRRAVANHFKRHFPEFLDHYALTCVEFFGGKRRFPEGNPAHHCRELFETAEKAPGLLSNGSVDAFKAVQ